MKRALKTELKKLYKQIAKIIEILEQKSFLSKVKTLQKILKS